MNKEFNPDILHDGILEKICFSWEEGMVEIFIMLNRYYVGQSESNKVHLVLRKAAYLNIQNKNPWGKSAYINEVALDKNNSDSTLTIEMQSGDRIEISYVELEIIE